MAITVLDPYPAPRVIIRRGHDDLSETEGAWEYHEWTRLRENAALDRLGRPNPRMWRKAWQRWRCNNTECYAVAFVNEDDLATLIEETDDA